MSGEPLQGPFEPLAPYGPSYPNLGSGVRKWRALARVRELTPEERWQYGEAVHRAILALQQTEARRGMTPTPPTAYRYSYERRRASIITALDQPYGDIHMVGDGTRDEQERYQLAMKGKNR